MYNVSDAQLFDEGNYTCNVTNSHGADAKTMFLNVTGKYFQ